MVAQRRGLRHRKSGRHLVRERQPENGRKVPRSLVDRHEFAFALDDAVFS